MFELEVKTDPYVSEFAAQGGPVDGAAAPFVSVSWWTLKFTRGVVVPYLSVRCTVTATDQKGTTALRYDRAAYPWGAQEPTEAEVAIPDGPRAWINPDAVRMALEELNYLICSAPRRLSTLPRR